jgi:hypothetical protein
MRAIRLGALIGGAKAGSRLKRRTPAVLRCTDSAPSASFEGMHQLKTRRALRTPAVLHRTSDVPPRFIVNPDRPPCNTTKTPHSPVLQGNRPQWHSPCIMSCHRVNGDPQK